jgi:hypothetical protein
MGACLGTQVAPVRGPVARLGFDATMPRLQAAGHAYGGSVGASVTGAGAVRLTSSAVHRKSDLAQFGLHGAIAVSSSDVIASVVQPSRQNSRLIRRRRQRHRRSHAAISGFHMASISPASTGSRKVRAAFVTASSVGQASWSSRAMVA